MEHFDVVIVGAGISGIGAACHLQDRCPDKSYAILESRAASGGTWDLFRYPGIRSDSDMHTMGYGFEPWNAEKAIADGPSIREYVRRTSRDHGVDSHIRYHHELARADWSSPESKWLLEIRRGDRKEPTRMSCNFLSMCSGYYEYDEGYTPEFEGRDDFRGTIVHPQHWPEDLDHSGRRIAVIGSGATAITLVPALAQDAAHVTMIQRSPSYIVSRPSRDAIANGLRRLLPDSLAYRITRFKNIQLQRFIYHRTRVAPEDVKRRLLQMVRKQLGPGHDIEKHFTPNYDPWDQRLCLVPDGDFFRALESGRATIVTDRIDRFDATGIQLESGEKVEADIIVTATGLNLQVLGGVEFSIDGKKLDVSEHYSYKGMMLSDVPNLVQTFGYINASWTLRADLTAEWVCRALARMDELGRTRCVPRLGPEAAQMPALPWIDDFTPGYMQRSLHLFPKQGDRDPWRNTQNYTLDRKLLRDAPLEDGVLRFESPA